jgi:hypothetical protein
MESSPNIYAGKITLAVQYDGKEYEDVTYQVTVLPTALSVLVAVSPIKYRQAHYTPAICFGLYNGKKDAYRLSLRNFKVYKFTRGSYQLKGDFGLNDKLVPNSSYADLAKIVIEDFRLINFDNLKDLMKSFRTHKKFKEFTFSVHHNATINSTTNSDFLMTKIIPSVASRLNAN